MSNYKRIPVQMTTGSGRALLEYGIGKGLTRVTIYLENISASELYKPYLLWENSFFSLPEGLKVDNMGHCTLRCETEVENPEYIRAIAVISQSLTPAAIGYINGEYDWRKCFMLDSKSEEKPPAEDEKQRFKAIVCHLDDDIRELKEYTKPLRSDANTLFESRAKTEPYSGCTGEWIKISLRELAFAGSLWRYMNDPLVLYAYSKHGFIYLGRQGEVLSLAVPWIYDKGYRLEAGIQGFNEIKTVDGSAPQNGSKCCLIAVDEQQTATDSN